MTAIASFHLAILTWGHERVNGEGEGGVAFFSAKYWDHRSREDRIESATPCHDTQVLGFFLGSSSVDPTVLAAKSEDCNTAPQYLRHCIIVSRNCRKDTGGYDVCARTCI